MRTALLGFVLLAAAARAQVTQRVSVDSAGVQGDLDSRSPAISADGRWVAFASLATNLVPRDTNGFYDVFVRDRVLGTTERVSVDSAGAQANGDSGGSLLSANGRFVVFGGSATNLVPGDTNGLPDVFLHDRRTGATERVSLDPSGAQWNLLCTSPAISGDGSCVAFVTVRWLDDTHVAKDVYVRDRAAGTTELVSVDDGRGRPGNGPSDLPSLSFDGRFVVFASAASNLVPGDTNATADVFLRDRAAATTRRISLDSSGAQANAWCSFPSISADGGVVAFVSPATNLVPGDTNGVDDVFVRHLAAGTTERASVATSGAQAGSWSGFPAISADGQCVLFVSGATNLVPADTNGFEDLFVRDLPAGTTERVSLAWDGSQAHGSSGSRAISADGGQVAFDSYADDLVPNDEAVLYEVFLRDRTGGTSFTVLCKPGVAGVIACPCSNPPAGPGRGCDNSSFTGGAVLGASGGAFLSSDTLAFAVTGAKPSALSVLLQGRTVVAGGFVYGQGVRCAGGPFARLDAKSATGGTAKFPDFHLGEPSISERSRARGDSILPGESRVYLVYYRDPTVLGGCPSASRFNATPTGSVTWSP